MITFYEHKWSFYNKFEVCAKLQLNSSLNRSLFIWHLLNQPNVIWMWKGPISKWGVWGFFVCLFLPPKHFCFVTLDTQTFPNLNKENPAFLCWNPMSQVHFLGANKYFQFTDRNLTKPGLQLSRLHQRHCRRTPTGQDICFPSVDSGAPGRKDQG